jgi:23S rRNA (cytosine1962-C5)-methyltransferase
MQIIHDEILRHLPRGGESRRLFHGRGHCFAGYEDLVIDYFSPVVMVILYRPRPQAWLDSLTQLLVEVLPENPRAILLQERFLSNGPSRLLQGTLPEHIDAQEAGLSYRLRLEGGPQAGL